MNKDIYQESLLYHQKKPHGKISITPTKPLDDREDLVLAYSPGVAEPCRVIAKDPTRAYDLTSKSNLIAVISNGTAVLGLGNIGALASKPVMEGKAVLFKKFANIDAYDIEINETDPDKLIEIIASLEPTFGGINLEDIKAPECFEIERKLKEKMNIPVFHDDQHGTAVIVSAAIYNALELINKKIEDVKLVTSGAGAAALACLNLLVEMGMKKENIIVCDSKGVVYKDRNHSMDPYKAVYANDTSARTLEEAIVGADIFLGLSVANIMTETMVKSMAPSPLILALSNPEPEASPELVKRVRSDAIIATGRSDYPNQVNNVLCFPYLFRGALDVGATKINEEMKIACVKAIAQLARAETSDQVSNAYKGEIHRFGPEYIIPKPFDPRLFVELAVAVAKAAMETKVATRSIDLVNYRHDLEEFVHRTSPVMRPVFSAAKKKLEKPIRIAFGEGEEPRVLQAVQTLVDKEIGKPILIGRPEVILWRINHLGLRLEFEKDYEIIDPNHDDRYPIYWQAYHKIMERKGVSPDVAKMIVRTNNTVIGSLMLQLGDVEAFIGGVVGRYIEHFSHVTRILGTRPDVSICAALCALILKDGPLFLCDPYVNVDPTVEELVEMVMLSAEQVECFGLTPKIALLSHSNFGSSRLESAQKMRAVLEIVKERAPHLEIEGEMHADLALDEEMRFKHFPHSQLSGKANLLIFPNIESANITYNLTRSIEDSATIGPILMGINKPAHILTSTASVRSIVNLASLAVLEAQKKLLESTTK